MGKTQDAVDLQMNGAVHRLREIDRGSDLTSKERDVVGSLQAVARGLYVIASHMDEDRDDNRRFQNRSFV
jgi:hypothetical protein